MKPQYGFLTKKKTGAMVALTIIYFNYFRQGRIESKFYIGTLDPDSRYRQIESEEVYNSYEDALAALKDDTWTQKKEG